jgi:hypothetical protein
MKRRKWHLDLPYEETLFLPNWPAASNALLLKLFSHIESADRPVLSMLPPGVSPAGAAAAASILFMPGMASPPKPHCRIALFPGLHFVRQMRSISLNPVALWKTSQKARSSGRGYTGVKGAFDKLRQKHREADPPLFHWIFKCQRTWTRNWRKEANELLPRANYGRGDPYLATVDFIETEHLDVFSDPSNPYDLLIYCPYFHSRTTEQTEEDLDILVSKISKFAADRKLVIARSPFNYWSRRLEEKLGTTGIALTSEDIGQCEDPSRQSDIQFIIVNQFIDLSESLDLFNGIRSLSRGQDVNRQAINEMKFILRRLLVSIDPTPREGEPSLDDSVRQLEGLADALEFPRDGKAWEVIQILKTRVASATGATKLAKLRELASNGPYEIWVTKDLDRQILTDFKQAHGLDIGIRLADRWLAPGLREPGRTVVLSRIDREGDLDLTAYLKSNDAIVMSAWEAAVRGASIMMSWERSERWREQAKRLKLIEARKEGRYTDPVLDLANFLDSAAVNHRAKLSPKAPAHEPPGETPSWWDDHDVGSILDTNLGREQLLATDGESSVLCRELIFEGSFGMFVGKDDEIQIIGAGDTEGEIVTIPVNDLEPGMTIIFFKDAERGSIFDILMDQLERSSEHQVDARAVREWKTRLREHVITTDVKIPDLVNELTKRGRTFDHITVRSWIYGSTMAPMREESLALLVEAIGLRPVNVKQLFKSVMNLRIIARALGRALNEIIIHKDLDQLDAGLRAALVSAGIDLDELSAAIETRKLTEMLPHLIEIERRNIRKFYRVSESLD